MSQRFELPDEMSELTDEEMQKLIDEAEANDYEPDVIEED